MGERNLVVRVDRDECTICGNCWTLCPEVFEQSTTDEKSEITAEYRVQGDLGKGNVPNNLPCVNDAEDQCPVQIIHVISGSI